MYTLTRMKRRNGLLPPFENLFQEFAAPTTGWVPSLDVVETPDAYLVKLDLPGVEPGDLDISIAEGVLEIKGERKVEEKKEGEGWHRVERRYGSFCRSVRLPDAVDTAKVAAASKHGVLTVTLPKAERAKPRHIDVKVD
jgi:HSP20 family protein